MSTSRDITVFTPQGWVHHYGATSKITADGYLVVADGAKTITYAPGGWLREEDAPAAKGGRVGEWMRSGM